MLADLFGVDLASLSAESLGVQGCLTKSLILRQATLPLVRLTIRHWNMGPLAARDYKPFQRKVKKETSKKKDKINGGSWQ